ncbi:MAG TPA: hypothetical protein VMT61_02270 [Candidatus Binataceae bacterium]|nr:hypothetical protein [Candidatus Binataceae bacterium]
MTAEHETRISDWAAEHHLPDTYRDRWLELAPEDAMALISVTEGLHLRTGQFVVAFEILVEIAARDRVSIATILERRELRRIVEGKGSGPGKASALLDALRLIRFPRLQEMLDRLYAQIRALGLPSGVLVSLPSDLATDELRIEIAAHGGLELRNLLKLLAENADALCRIADALGGTYEV